MSNKRYQLTYTLTEETLKTGVSDFIKIGTRNNSVVSLNTTVLVLMGGLALVNREYFIGLVLFGYAFFDQTYMKKQYLKQALKRFREIPGVLEPKSIVFTDKLVISKSKYAKSEMHWVQFNKLIVGKRYVFLMQFINTGVSIPKIYFNDDCPLEEVLLLARNAGLKIEME
jgi:hypothetical protein